MASEKRKFPRVKVAFDVEIFHPQWGLRHFRTRDLSHSGMFIIDGLPEKLPVTGEIVRVVIKSGGEPMTVDMQVVRHSVEGRGLTFI